MIIINGVEQQPTLEDSESDYIGRTKLAKDILDLRILFESMVVNSCNQNHIPINDLNIYKYLFKIKRFLF